MTDIGNAIMKKLSYLLIYRLLQHIETVFDQTRSKLSYLLIYRLLQRFTNCKVELLFQLSYLLICRLLQLDETVTFGALDECCHTCSYAGFYNANSQYVETTEISCHTCSYAGFYNVPTYPGSKKNSELSYLLICRLLQRVLKTLKVSQPCCHTCSYAGFYNTNCKVELLFQVVIPAHMQASTTI